MEQGRALLGALELAGAALFAAGLALRSAHRKLRPSRNTPHSRLTGRLVLILGADQPLGRELCLQLTQLDNRVACAGSAPGPPPGLPRDAPYFCCDPGSPSALQQLAQRLAGQMGTLDLVIWAPPDVQNKGNTQLDQLANVVNGDLMMHFHVVSQFVPILAQSPGGHFVCLDPRGIPSGAFAATGLAITALADTLTQHIADSALIRKKQNCFCGSMYVREEIICNGRGGDAVGVTRVLRRTARRGDEEDLAESAAAILRAMEAGNSSLTLPSATQHIKNTLRYLKRELGNLWNQTISRHWKLSTR